MAVDRVKTGIKGFDELVGGGFLRNTNILVSGGPGTGKTVFALQAAYNLAKRGDVVYYLSFEQNLREILLEAAGLGWDFQPLITAKKFVFRNIPTAAVDVDLSAVISKDVKQFKPSVVVVDSVTKLSIIADSLRIAMDPTDFEKLLGGKNELSTTRYTSGTQLQKFVYLLLERFKKYGTTNLIITDVPTNDGQTVEGSAEFAADTVIALYNLRIGQRKARTLEVLKMRRSEASNAIASLEILPNKGIVVKKEEQVYK